MYAGDRSRKEVLVSYGFRLPSALDNRPLSFEEWEQRVGQLVYVSATPGPYELHKSGGVVVEQIIRPDRADGPAHRRAARARPGRRPAAGDPGARRQARARAGDDAHQEDGRGPHVVLPRARREGPLPALGHRHARADRDPARPAARRLRRAGGHQPAARGAGSAGSLAGGDSRRRQGGLPALGRVAHPDLRPRGAQRERPRHHVRRQADRFDAAVPVGDRAPPRDSGGVQRRARHHAHLDRQVH